MSNFEYVQHHCICDKPCAIWRNRKGQSAKFEDDTLYCEFHRLNRLLTFISEAKHELHLLHSYYTNHMFRAWKRRSVQDKVKGVVLVPPSLTLKVARTRLPFRTAHSLPTLHWSCPIPLAAFFALFNLVFGTFSWAFSQISSLFQTILQKKQIQLLLSSLLNLRCDIIGILVKEEKRLPLIGEGVKWSRQGVGGDRIWLNYTT